MENRVPEDPQLSVVKKRLDTISPSMCLAKWLQVSLHLTTGKTHSCYHPPVHDIDVDKIKEDPTFLHNTVQKKKERAQMLQGERPKGCSYCWNIEDCGSTYSDRHYRSMEPWAIKHFEEISKKNANENITPSYVEVNFNHACQFKCSYCSPHLSSSWMEESKKFGHWPTTVPHNDIRKLKKKGLYPIPLEEHNPYVEAFWKWWPDLYPNLKVFRMTGGEPLLDHNTFRVLDYIEKHPNPSLELAITTNLCPPEKMMNRFIKQITSIMKKKQISRFMIFPSIDTWGVQAEYIRHGLNVENFEKNVKRLLKECPDLSMSFIITTNALSIFNLKKLLEKILEWSKEYTRDRHRIYFDIPYLKFPPWQALDILPVGIVRGYLEDCLSFMEENHYIENKRNYGFGLYEIDKVRRLLSLTQKPVNQITQRINRIDFYKFFKEHDRRRNTDFLKTFPELKAFWNFCKNLNEKGGISPVFCVYPWMAFLIGPTQNVKICCVAEDYLESKSKKRYSSNTSSLESIWNSEGMREVRRKMLAGEKVSACKNCYHQESIGKTSHRQLSNKEWFGSEWGSIIKERIWESKKNDYVVDEAPLYLDIRPGNLCNLKCRMCNPGNSSPIYKEHKELLLDKKDSVISLIDTKYFSEDEEKFQSWSQSSNLWKTVYNWMPTVKQLSFSGGEPALIEKNWELLDYAQNKGYSKKIHLIFSLNCTYVPEKLLKTFDNFLSVSLYLSVDGLGKVQEYIRHPSKWYNIERNIIKILKRRKNNVKIYLFPVVQIYNILYLVELLKWADGLQKKYGLINSNLVMCNTPSYFDLAILPQNIRILALKDIELYQKDYQGKDDYLMECLDVVKRTLRNVKKRDSELQLKQFFQYTYILDEKRKNSFKEALPLLHAMLQGVEKNLEKYPMASEASVRRPPSYQKGSLFV